MLLTQRVQIVFLTAMLPSYIQGKFIRIMKINPYKVHVFQVLMTCANITYSVFKHNLNKDKADTVY
jgi:hypothetical protein